MDHVDITYYAPMGREAPLQDRDGAVSVSREVRDAQNPGNTTVRSDRINDDSRCKGGNIGFLGCWWAGAADRSAETGGWRGGVGCWLFTMVEAAPKYMPDGFEYDDDINPSQYSPQSRGRPIPWQRYPTHSESSLSISEMRAASALIALGLAALPALARDLFPIPPGATARVSIIDSTLQISNIPDTVFLTPKLKGLDIMPPAPAWCFLIESSTGQKAVFDLSVSPDPFNSYTPAIVQQLKDFGWDIQIKKHVAEVLEDGGVNLTEISSIIWSHWHFDHIGDVSTFPTTTEIVVGPGFKKAFLPAYPTNPESPLHERYFA